jgi:hypothetical protein
MIRIITAGYPKERRPTGRNKGRNKRNKRHPNFNEGNKGHPNFNFSGSMRLAYQVVALYAEEGDSDNVLEG